MLPLASSMLETQGLRSTRGRPRRKSRLSLPRWGVPWLAALTVFAVLGIAPQAWAVAPICSDLAQSDLAPAPMHPTDWGSLEAGRNCDEGAASVERGSPAPQPDPRDVLTSASLRAMPVRPLMLPEPKPALWPVGDADRIVLPLHARAIFRPPCCA
jgi:hypothetical protein